MSASLSRKTLNLFRLIVHEVFSNDRASEACISVRPAKDGAQLIAIATDCDAFGKFYSPTGVLRTVIAETCRTMAVVCRDKAIMHSASGSDPVEPEKIEHERTICSIGVEVWSIDQAMGGLLVDLFESLIPPPNIHLEVQGHHIHARAPLSVIGLSVGDGVLGKRMLMGEVHNVPVKARDPKIFVGGIPVGLCTVDYQFNITSGIALKDAADMLGEINAALSAGISSLLNGEV